jgi:hypothetical protein
VYYLETAVSVAQPFLSGADTPQYVEFRGMVKSLRCKLDTKLGTFTKHLFDMIVEIKLRI